MLDYLVNTLNSVLKHRSRVYKWLCFELNREEYLTYN